MVVDVGAVSGSTVSLSDVLETACTAFTVLPDWKARPPIVDTAPCAVAVTLTTFARAMRPFVHLSAYRVRYVSLAKLVGRNNAIFPCLSDIPSKSPKVFRSWNTLMISCPGCIAAT
jgi:hypothetical protein